MRSPIRWFGGKGVMTAKILPLLPPCRCYVEVFGGGASLLFARNPVPVEVYNDLDEILVDFFRVLSHPTLFKKFRRRVEVLPWSRRLFEECRETYQDETDPVERSVKWFLASRQCFSGILKKKCGWSFTKRQGSRWMAEGPSKWLSIIELLPEIHARLQRVQIDCYDWRKILDNYDTGETLFYLDPPYLPDTRRDGEYRHELSEQDHYDLIDRLLKIEGQAALSGYPNEVYAPLDRSDEWERFEWKTSCLAAPRKGKGDGMKNHARTEVLWVKRNRSRLLKGFGI